MLNVVMEEFKPGGQETLRDYKQRVYREVNSRIRAQGYSVNTNWLERKWFDDMLNAMNLLVEEQPKGNSEAVTPPCFLINRNY